jgi:hypothetical protein
MLDVRTVLCKGGTCVVLLLLMTYVTSQQLRGHRSDPSECYILCYVRDSFPCWKEQNFVEFLLCTFKVISVK